jgi:hypothetical protein
MDLTRFKESGDLYLPASVKEVLDTYIIGSDDSLFYITMWSIMHTLSGVFIALVLVVATPWSSLKSALIAFIIHSLWELWQWVIHNTPRNLRGALDIVVDTLMFMLGFTVTYYLVTTVQGR